MFDTMATFYGSDTFFLLMEWWTKSSLILVLAFLTTWFARKMSASNRSLIWLTAIFALVLLPVVIWFGPSYNVAVNLPVNNQAPVPPVTMSDSAIPLVTEQNTPSIAREQVMSTEALLKKPKPAPRDTSVFMQFGLLPLLIGIWLLGMAGVLLWSARGHFFIYRLVRGSQPIDDPHILDSAHRIGEHFGLKWPVAIRASSRVKNPMVCGLMRPMVLLPEHAWQTWSHERIDMVLLHEFAHVARRDVLMRAICYTLLAFHWFNPLLWIALNRLSWEQEKACDDLVLAAGTKPSAYAKTLLSLVQSGHKPSLLCVRHLTGKTVKNRIISVLNPDLQRRPMRRLGTLAMFSTALTFLLPLAVSDPVDALGAKELDTVLTGLRSNDATEVTKAAILLREMSAPQSIPRLVEMLEDDRVVPDKWLHSYYSRFSYPKTPGRAAAVTLAASGPEAHAQLMRAVQTENTVVRANAAFGLGLTHKSDRLPVLFDLLANSDAQTRVGVEEDWSLNTNSARNPETIMLLLDALADSDARVRIEAAWSLGMIRDPVAIAGLTNALSDEYFQVRQRAAWSLGMIRGKAATGDLIRALGDERLQVRRNITWALGMIRDADAVAALVTGLDDPEAQVRSTSVSGSMGARHDSIRSSRTSLGLHPVERR